MRLANCLSLWANSTYKLAILASTWDNLSLGYDLNSTFKKEPDQANQAIGLDEGKRELLLKEGESLLLVAIKWRFEALPKGKRELPFLLPSVETEIEDWAFSLFYREAAGVNSVSSSSPWFRKGRGTQTFFAQSSITINRWLHYFLWAQASQWAWLLART
ncbi:hypothetical protein Tco_1505863 [Tanacetum coccineum]